MTLYPKRKHISEESYLELSRNGEAWALFDDLINGRRAMFFLPGSLQFGLVGFLAVIPVAAIIIVLLLTVFKHEAPAFSGAFMVAGSFVLMMLHGFFMLLVGLGFIYAQQYLVRYLALLMIASFLMLSYGLYSGAQAFVLLFSLFGFLVAVLIWFLARALSFTLYADLMRVKRLYYRYQRRPSRR